MNVAPDRPVVAIDLGGTKALAGVVEADGAVRSRVWLPSRDLNGRPAELLDRLAEGAAAAAAEAGEGRARRRRALREPTGAPRLPHAAERNSAWRSAVADKP